MKCRMGWINGVIAVLVYQYTYETGIASVRTSQPHFLAGRDDDAAPLEPAGAGAGFAESHTSHFSALALFSYVHEPQLHGLGTAGRTGAGGGGTLARPVALTLSGRTAGALPHTHGQSDDGIIIDVHITIHGHTDTASQRITSRQAQGFRKIQRSQTQSPEYPPRKIQDTVSEIFSGFWICGRGTLYFYGPAHTDFHSISGTNFQKKCGNLP